MHHLGLLGLPRTDILLGRIVTAPSATSSRCSTGAILEPQLSEPIQKKWPVWLAFRAASSTRLWEYTPAQPSRVCPCNCPHAGHTCSWALGSSPLPHAHTSPLHSPCLSPRLCLGPLPLAHMSPGPTGAPAPVPVPYPQVHVSLCPSPIPAHRPTATPLTHTTHVPLASACPLGPCQPTGLCAPPDPLLSPRATSVLTKTTLVSLVPYLSHVWPRLPELHLPNTCPLRFRPPSP